MLSIHRSLVCRENSGPQRVLSHLTYVYSVARSSSLQSEICFGVKLIHLKHYYSAEIATLNNGSRLNILQSLKPSVTPQNPKHTDG